ncbi:MAG: putative metal-binding motif-containing protein [Myxococcales bacterium]|nr:putative metal-binding motif-containing protein [Myxococcales bacterium]
MPTTGSVAASSPVFDATTDCARVRLQYWDTLTPQNKQLTAWRLPGPLQVPEDQWDTLPAGVYAWRWVGNSPSGPGVSATNMLIVEADVDDDGWTDIEGDCDDLDPAVHPGATGICGTDANCDGLTDMGWTASGMSLDGPLSSGAPGAPASIDITDQDVTLCPGTYYARFSASGGIATVDGGDALVSGDSGRAFSVTSGGSLAVSNVEVSGSSNGFFCNGSTLELADVDAHDNVGDYGAGVLGETCVVDLTSSIVRNNHAPSSAAVHARDGSTLTITDSEVSGNTSVNGGGVSAALGSSFDCVRSRIVGNTASDGSAVYLVHDSPMTLDHCDLGEPGTADENQGSPDVVTWDNVSVGYYDGGSDANDGCTLPGSQYLCGAAQFYGGTNVRMETVPGTATLYDDHLQVTRSLTLSEISVVVQMTDPNSFCAAEMWYGISPYFGQYTYAQMVLDTAVMTMVIPVDTRLTPGDVVDVEVLVQCVNPNVAQIETRDLDPRVGGQSGITRVKIRDL